MIRAFVSLMVLTFASVSFAGKKCEDLVLSCRAVYQAYDGGTEVETVESNFSDEGWDEPSLANCASSAYLQKGDTVVRIYANKDLQKDSVLLTAMAVQTEEKTVNGEMVRSAKYSKESKATASVGMIMNLGSVSFPTAIPMGDSMVNGVYLGCSVK